MLKISEVGVNLVKDNQGSPIMVCREGRATFHVKSMPELPHTLHVHYSSSGIFAGGQTEECSVPTQPRKAEERGMFCSTQPRKAEERGSWECFMYHRGTFIIIGLLSVHVTEQV
jgi:hypothetical protein